MEEVYILVIDWADDSGERGGEIKVYSTCEKAKEIYDNTVKTIKFYDPMYVGCFDSEGKFIENNDEGFCCDEFGYNDTSDDGESFSVYQESYYSTDHYTVYYRKVKIDA